MYYDNAATAAIDEGLNIGGYYYSFPRNPSSQHSYGKEAKADLEKARSAIAKSINAKKEEIIFTSGGTEADNLAIKGFAFAHENCKILTIPIEHKAILKSCEFLKERNIADYEFVEIDGDGVVVLEDLRKKCEEAKGKSLLVSIQFANNEIGTIQQIREIGKIVHEFGGTFHVDAVQAYGVININVKFMEIDMMSVSGHKFHAPNGVGFLYKKKNVEICPLISGGSQEFGLRAGTENLPCILAMAEEVNRNDYFSSAKCEKRAKAIEKVRDEIETELLTIPNTIINGSVKNRLPGNINVSFKDINGEVLMMLLDYRDIQVSNGSACNSNDKDQSYVLRAIHVPEDYISGTIRLTLTWCDDIDKYESAINPTKTKYMMDAHEIVKNVEQLRRYLKK